MKILAYVLLVALTTTTYSCKKKGDDKASESQLIGKWMLTKWSYNDHYDGADHRDEGTYDPGDYIEFESDGVVILRADGTIYQAVWRLIDDGKTILITGNDDIDAPDTGFEIRSISNSNLELYSREDDGDDYYESTIYLKK